jgi:hypothetical protein
MKNLIMALAIFCATTMYVSAQDINFGLKAGVNFASLNGDDIDDLDGVTGLHIGAVAEFGFSEKFSIQPELIYSTQGASLDDETLKLDYINIPVLAKYYIIEGLSLEAGPQLGFNINSEYEFDGETEDEEGVNTIDIAAGLGAGYKLPVGIFFQARYNIGLTDVYEEIQGFQIDAKNNVFQISVGYMF